MTLEETINGWGKPRNTIESVIDGLKEGGPPVNDIFNEFN